MPNPNGAKGSDHERKVVRYLADEVQAYRPHAEGFADVGDIHAFPFALQAKNWGDTTAALNVGVRDSEIQAGRAGLAYGAAVIKKRGANVSEARVALTLRTFRRVLKRLLRAEEALRFHAPQAYADHAAQIGDD